MRNFILLAVTLYLAIAVKDINSFEPPLKFGDILSFKRTCPCLPSSVFYKHFAIYVDNATLDGRLENQDIFHHTKTTDGFRYVFGTMTNDSVDPQVENYLDDLLEGDLQVGTEKNFTDRIAEKNGVSGEYNLLKNNCEHLATYIRYGKPCSEQRGTLAEPLARMLCQRGLKSCPSVDKKKLIKVFKELEENAKLEEECMTCNLSSG